MYSRFFQQDEEWCAFHIPHKPNGFAVFILGDKNSYVDNQSSFWLQNYGRYQMIKYLLDDGYTVFYSNLYGRNWGSQKAVSLALTVYHLIMKEEILNKKVHILAEGMGTLIAFELMNQHSEIIRSVALMNPCISLERHLVDEKQHKFFYKNLVQEIIKAYQLPNDLKQDSVEQYLPIRSLPKTHSVKIWQTTTNSLYNPARHSRYFEDYRKQYYPILLNYYLAEKRFSIGQSVCNFYRKNEQIL
ncbi:alpha/beta hydrolase family protein [Litchfieldia alkalitelluris]|uniref:hypothetical protein n=1 Tax=Litchfieldia alkalitelluris TaxID=304268 RepID=UPI001F468294|nr:hypothetical protein [Litchfieldia alkalitelluris]